MEEEMKIVYNKNGKSGFVFDTPKELVQFFSTFVFVLNNITGTGNGDVNKAFAEAEDHTHQKVRTEEEMRHIHTCRKCNGFIDDRKDRFYHNEQSDYEEWQHIPECPSLKEFK